MLNIDEIKDKRIAVLLSGGVDSSVVVWEFAQLGLHPDCFYIKIGPEEKEEWDCSSEEDLEMATAVARKYGCKLQVVDCHHEYWNEVTRYTMEKVKAGFTPNPDVMCNRLIKFGAFDEKMGHNYDLIATGHYAQTETDENGDKWLVTSPDPVKDQTDFLAQIESWQLKKAIFPIGHHIKNEVREIAEEEHLINAKRKDSQGICFLGQINRCLCTVRTCSCDNRYTFIYFINCKFNCFKMFSVCHCRRLTGCSTDNNGICAVGDLEFQQFFQFIVIHLSIFIHRGNNCDARTFKNCHFNSSFYSSVIYIIRWHPMDELPRCSAL